MGAESAIEWTDHTFNPWIGCTKVSPGCAHCYAETLDDRRYSRTLDGGSPAAPVSHWGPGKPRHRTSAANWKLPYRWNREAGLILAGTGEGFLAGSQEMGKPGRGQDLPDEAGWWRVWYSHVDLVEDCYVREMNDGRFISHKDEEVACGVVIQSGIGKWMKLAAVRRPRVFCASMADWLDEEVPIEWLADLLRLIQETPNLDWLLLTKRPQNFQERVLMAGMHMMGYRDGDKLGEDCKPLAFANATEATIESVLGWSKRETLPANVWMGTTVEDQTRADERIPRLLEIPARVRFLSCEPLLGPVDLTAIDLAPSLGIVRTEFHPPLHANALTGLIAGPDEYGERIHWIIAGGESGDGKGAQSPRPMHPVWARGLRDECVAAGVPFFFKQWGSHCDHASRATLLKPDQCMPEATVWLDSRGGAVEYDPDAYDRGDNEPMYRVAKHAAGRLLDGREWSEVPAGLSIRSAQGEGDLTRSGTKNAEGTHV